MSKKHLAPICPYCGKKSICVDSAAIYGQSYGWMWICPPCKAYVGCHGSTKRPKGSLANATLREYRKRAHAAFDVHWMKGASDPLHRGRGPGERRAFAYTSLARVLGMMRDMCHIAMMDESDCDRVVLACEYGLVVDNIIERNERHARENAEKAVEV